MALSEGAVAIAQPHIDRGRIGRMNLQHIILAIAVQIAHQNRIVIPNRCAHGRLKCSIAIAQYGGK